MNKSCHCRQYVLTPEWNKKTTQTETYTLTNPSNNLAMHKKPIGCF